MNIIKSFNQCINYAIYNISKDIKIRKNNIIQFRDIIYYSSYLIGNNKSYDDTNSHLKIKNITNVTKKTLIKEKNKIHFKYFKKLNDSLIDYIYEDSINRIIAVDSTYLELYKSLNIEGFNISRNGNYCTGLISTLFDVDKEIPIIYGFYKFKNEREALMHQLNYLKKNDILIMDRGYYSIELLFQLNSRHIKVIFRLKKNLKIIKNLNKCNSKIIEICYKNTLIKFRVVKYLINNKKYYLGTTIYDCNIDYLKKIYWKRWKIEINFRYSKYNLSLKELKSKNYNTLMQDILIHNFIFIVSSFFQYILQKDINTYFKINTKNMLCITINELLYLIIYKNATRRNLNEIMRILKIAQSTVIPKYTNRKYERVKKRPSSKWCQHGNKFKMAYI